MKIPKIIKWEFWPFWFFYIPVYAKWISLGIKARSFMFFTASNPSMEMGGFGDYSKFATLETLPQEYKPLTYFITGDNKKQKILNHNIDYPFILKPDRGERGYGVEKIDNEASLEHYLKNAVDEIILQEYVPYAIEVGVMYHRIPGNNNGEITSVVIKEFLSTTGDGSSTLQELFKKGNRTKFYLDLLFEKYEHRLNEVLNQHEYIELEAIGNHCRGTAFLNGNHLINEQLVEVFDKISLKMEDHFFGRFDLRVSSYEDLYNGKNIKIMEVNGANSEPAHIYDPSMRIMEAYRVLFSHWQNLYEVSIVNRNKGIEYMPLGVGIKKLRTHTNSKG